MPIFYVRVFYLPGRIFFFLCVPVLFLILGGCSELSVKDKITEGVIIYDIAYTNNAGRSFPLQLLPKNLEMKFNHRYFSFTIEDRFKFFLVRNITNLAKHSQLTLIKVFNKKYVFKGDDKEPPVFFKESIPYRVTFLPDTQRMAGLLCRKAWVADRNSSKRFDVFYTSDIKIHHPNYGTPYEAIDDLMLKFRIEMKDLEMTVVASKVNPGEVSDDDFLIPEGYKLISKSQMEEIINTLLP